MDKNIPEHSPVHMIKQVVEMLVELGYVGLEVRYTDETKMESDANKYTFT